MNPLNRTLRGAALAVMACSTLLLASCSSDVSGQAVPVAGDVGTSTSPTTTTTVQAAPSGQEGNDTGGDIDFEVEIGECVELGGTQFDATIDDAECGGPDSNYKVIGKAPTNAECVSDVDQYYYETLDDIEQGALCLDVDWVIGGCMDVPFDDDPERVDCNAPKNDTVRVVEILNGTAEVDDCAYEATSGFPYDERNFIVCVEDL